MYPHTTSRFKHRDYGSLKFRDLRLPARRNVYLPKAQAMVKLQVRLLASVLINVSSSSWVYSIDSRSNLSFNLSRSRFLRLRPKLLTNFRLCRFNATRPGRKRDNRRVLIQDRFSNFAAKSMLKLRFKHFALRWGFVRIQSGISEGGKRRCRGQATAGYTRFCTVTRETVAAGQPSDAAELCRVSFSILVSTEIECRTSTHTTSSRTPPSSIFPGPHASIRSPLD
ncbi:hypothetical protein B0H11DRAFT_1911623 [Mycena galericulata]|nr:hypothetical protein B0H11DRAFT_1911623 [Mycena galericulata]